MNRAGNFIAVVGLGLGAGVAPADDFTAAVMTKRQMISECMEKQKTADVTLSKADMLKICKAQLKRQKTTGSFPEPPAGEPPRN